MYYILFGALSLLICNYLVKREAMMALLTHNLHHLLIRGVEFEVDIALFKRTCGDRLKIYYRIFQASDHRTDAARGFRGLLHCPPSHPPAFTSPWAARLGTCRCRTPANARLEGRRPSRAEATLTPAQTPEVEKKSGLRRKKWKTVITQIDQRSFKRLPPVLLRE